MNRMKFRAFVTTSALVLRTSLTRTIRFMCHSNLGLSASHVLRVLTDAWSSKPSGEPHASFSSAGAIAFYDFHWIEGNSKMDRFSGRDSGDIAPTTEKLRPRCVSEAKGVEFASIIRDIVPKLKLSIDNVLARKHR